MVVFWWEGLNIDGHNYFKQKVIVFFKNLKNPLIIAVQSKEKGSNLWKKILFGMEVSKLL